MDGKIRLKVFKGVAKVGSPDLIRSPVFFFQSLDISMKSKTPFLSLNWTFATCADTV